MKAVAMNPGSGGESLVFLYDANGDYPLGACVYATALNALGQADAIQVVTPTTPLPVRFADGTGFLASLPVTVAGNSFAVQVTVTRPANATPYTAGDVVGDASGSAIITFAGVGTAGGHVLITGADLRVDVGAIPAGMTQFRLHLYSAAPTGIADNAPWDLIAGDRASYLGYVDLGSPADLGSTLFTQADGVNKKVKLTTAALYGLLQTIGGFTPAGNSEVYAVRLQTATI